MGRLRNLGSAFGLAALLAIPAQAAELIKVPIDSVDEAIWQYYKPAEESAVCIRHKVLYKDPVFTSLAGEPVIHLKKATKFGSGCVVGEEMVNGNKEYLIVTNNHVGWAPENYSRFALEESRLSIVENSNDTDETTAIQLELIARDPDVDQSLLRTVNAKRKLTVFPYEFGLPKPELGPGDILIMTGFPQANKKLTNTGRISLMNFLLTTVTPYPAQAYVANIPIDPGSSGSPAVIVTVTKSGDSAYLRYNLIGLAFAKGWGDTTKYLTPLNIQKLLDHYSTPSKRPPLTTEITPTGLDSLVHDSSAYFDIAGKTTFDGFEGVGPHRFTIKRSGPDMYDVRTYALDGGMPIERESLDATIRVDQAGISVLRFMDRRTSEKENVVETKDNKFYNAVYTRLINHFGHIQDLKKIVSKPNRSVEENQMKEYYERFLEEDSEALSDDFLSLCSQLYKQRVVSFDFF